MRGGVFRVLSKLLYLKILHKYGCIIYPNAKVSKGFYISHPVGIVIGCCEIGENFNILQNATIGIRRVGDEQRGLIPKIGNNVRLCANSIIMGDVHVTDNVIIGANSVVISDITESGTYAGSPAKRVK